MNIYNVNYPRYVTSLVPVPKREPITLAWLKCAVKPLIELQATFRAFRDSTAYKLAHTGQVCYLQAVLNDEFDPNLRRIRIGNVGYLEPVWFAHPEEHEEVWHDDQEPVWYDDTSSFINNVDFYVLVPVALQPTTPAGVLAFETRMTAFINYYKLYSKNFLIKWVSN